MKQTIAAYEKSPLRQSNGRSMNGPHTFGVSPLYSTNGRGAPHGLTPKKLHQHYRQSSTLTDCNLLEKENRSCIGSDEESSTSREDDYSYKNIVGEKVALADASIQCGTNLPFQQIKEEQDDDDVGAGSFQGQDDTTIKVEEEEVGYDMLIVVLEMRRRKSLLSLTQHHLLIK